MGQPTVCLPQSTLWSPMIYVLSMCKIYLFYHKFYQSPIPSAQSSESHHLNLVQMMMRLFRLICQSKKLKRQVICLPPTHSHKKYTDVSIQKGGNRKYEKSVVHSNSEIQPNDESPLTRFQSLFHFLLSLHLSVQASVVLLFLLT